MKILITCPPMLGKLGELEQELQDQGLELILPEVKQTMSEEQLAELLPLVDGWIAGDDPATEGVLTIGAAGRLRAVVKWGVGIDNIDVDACHKLGLKFSHTPAMFGDEVADLALCYVIALAREVISIHQGVVDGGWPKPSGISLKSKVVGVIGHGDIGKNVCKRLNAIGMKIVAYDPLIEHAEEYIDLRVWPSGIEDCDFLVFTCALNQNTYQMLNEEILSLCKDGVRIVNVARGGLIDESAMEKALDNGKVHSVALDVFEIEPLRHDSPLRLSSKNIFGSHNASNTLDAVERTNERAVTQLLNHLRI